MPPKVLEIRGQKNGSTVEMREGQKLSLQCIAKNSKPATKLKWLRNGLEITKGKLKYSFFNMSLPLPPGWNVFYIFVSSTFTNGYFLCLAILNIYFKFTENRLTKCSNFISVLELLNINLILCD